MQGAAAVLQIDGWTKTETGDGINQEHFDECFRSAGWLCLLHNSFAFRVII